MRAQPASVATGPRSRLWVPQPTLATELMRQRSRYKPRREFEVSKTSELSSGDGSRVGWVIREATTNVFVAARPSTARSLCVGTSQVRIEVTNDGWRVRQAPAAMASRLRTV